MESKFFFVFLFVFVFLFYIWSWMALSFSLLFLIDIHNFLIGNKFSLIEIFGNIR